MTMILLDSLLHHCGIFDEILINTTNIFSRVILTYLTSAYAKDDTLYPKDIKIRALVDQRLQFDLSTLYQRMVDYYVR